MTKNQLKFQQKLDELAGKVEQCRQGKYEQRALASALRGFHDVLTHVADGAYLSEYDEYEREVWDVVQDPDCTETSGQLVRIDQLREVADARQVPALDYLTELCPGAVDGFFWATEKGYSRVHPALSMSDIPDWATHVFVYIESQ